MFTTNTQGTPQLLKMHQLAYYRLLYLAIMKSFPLSNMNQYPDIQLYQQEMLKMPVSQQLIMDVS